MFYEFDAMKRSENISASREPRDCAGLARSSVERMLRAAINGGNPALARKGLEAGDPTGPSVDLARELARRLGTPAAAARIQGGGTRVRHHGTRWDIAFMAIEPVRIDRPPDHQLYTKM